MAKMSLDLSDDLARLADNFDQFAHGGLVMDGETVLGIVATLRSLHAAARKLENEVSVRRWNEAALNDRRVSDRVLAALQEPDTNIRLFPVIPRPFTDGHPRRPGGAA